MSSLLQFAKTVKGFICSGTGADHTLSGAVIASEGILRFGVRLLGTLFFECGGNFSCHAI
jgi:hypothetical protein